MGADRHITINAWRSSTSLCPTMADDDRTLVSLKDKKKVEEQEEQATLVHGSSRGQQYEAEEEAATLVHRSNDGAAAQDFEARLAAKMAGDEEEKADEWDEEKASDPSTDEEDSEGATLVPGGTGRANCPSRFCRALFSIGRLACHSHGQDFHSRVLLCDSVTGTRTRRAGGFSRRRGTAR